MGELASKLRTSDFDYPLPESLIAQRPAAQRDDARLLLLDRRDRSMTDRTIRDLPDLVPPGDVLVLNETRVFPARLFGEKPTGAAVEVLLLRPLDPAERRWLALVRPGGKLKPGRVVNVGEGLEVVIEDSADGGARVVRLETAIPVREALDRYGHVPLPPYIRRQDDETDRARYQTVFARRTGSVAAPTAGLHLTEPLLAELGSRGVSIARLTLHVGPGTFRPVDLEDPARHVLDPEWYDVSSELVDLIRDRRGGGGKVWAVGTTVVRALESAFRTDGELSAGDGWTDLFILPGFRFRVVDRLITNFHLPRSTLLMLVAAFAGREPTLAAYRHAIEEGYRFYSYGDAMALI